MSLMSIKERCQGYWQSGTVLRLSLILLFCTGGTIESRSEGLDSSLVGTKAPMDESGKLLVEELPQPPEGYRWKVLPDINAGMVVPESWFFLKEESEGTFGYFFSKEDISVEGSYKVGLAINVIKKCSEVTGKSAARFARDYITKMIMNSDTLQTWSAKISTIEQYGCRSLIVGQDDSHIVSHTQAMGNLETDTFYLMIFESPKDDWPEVSEIGRTMLQLFILDDEV